SGDAEGDVLFQWHAKFFGTLAHVLARDALGEELVFHATLHRIHFQIQNTLRRTHVSASSEESGDFVASKECVLQRGLPWHTAIIRVREDGSYDLLGIALCAQNLCPLGRSEEHTSELQSLRHLV